MTSHLTRGVRPRLIRLAVASVSAAVATLGPLAVGVLAATPDRPPSIDPTPTGPSPVAVALQIILQTGPIVALVLAVLFRARLRGADGRRIGSVLAIRLLPLAGLAALGLGIAAIPVCAQLDHFSLLPGIECMVPGVVIAVIGGTSFILHAPLARALPRRPGVAAFLAIVFSVPVIVGYAMLDSAIRSAQI